MTTAATTTATIARMKCAKHKTIRVIPADRVVAWSGRITDATGADALLCGQDGCRYFMKAHYISGRVNTGISCDDRCRMATGATCSCQCGGRKHGIED